MPCRWPSLLCLAALIWIGNCPGVRADRLFEIVPDVVYGHKDGMALTFDVLRPKKNANGAAVLFMVSGGWYSRYAPPEQSAVQFGALLANGFTVFNVRHGSAPRYVIPEIIEDVRLAVRFVRLHASEYGVDPQRLGVFGGSAGGHLSLVLGTMADDGDTAAKDELLRTSDRVAAVVAYYPPTDVRPWTDPSSPYYQKYPALRFNPAKDGDCSPVLHVSPDDPPTLLISGDKDLLVPIEHSQKILAEFKAKQVPCELLVIPGAAHGFQGEDGKRASEAVFAWFQKYLAKP
jgi:acetyl esterase/lipase